jgi:hypothetical protein
LQSIGEGLHAGTNPLQSTRTWTRAGPSRPHARAHRTHSLPDIAHPTANPHQRDRRRAHPRRDPAHARPNRTHPWRMQSHSRARTRNAVCHATHDAGSSAHHPSDPAHLMPCTPHQLANRAHSPSARRTLGELAALFLALPSPAPHRCSGPGLSYRCFRTDSRYPCFSQSIDARAASP